MDVEKVAQRIQEAKKFCTMYRSKERSLDGEQQCLEEEVKRKTYYLEMLDSYTTLIAEVDERINSRRRRMEANSDFVEMHREKFKRLSKLLDSESERLFKRIDKLQEDIKKEQSDGAD